MSELRALSEAARQLRARAEPFLSATVVRVRGSGYRRAGARMLASREAWLAGSISGGCLERDVMTKGFWRTRSTQALLVMYDETEAVPGERSGSGCQGVVEILLEQHAPGVVLEADVFVAAERCLREESVAAVVSVFRSTRPDVPVGARWVAQQGELHGTHASRALGAELGRVAEAAIESQPSPYVVRSVAAEGELEALVECIVPPPHLFVFGSGHDAVPVVTLAKNLGWSVSVWDALPRSSTRERFHAADHYLTGKLEHAVARLTRCVRPAAVIMGHHLEQDRAALAALLPAGPRYLGLLGPRQRTEQLLADCRNAGVTVDEATLARLYAPVGLQLGAQTPAEIALAIVAEAQAALTQSDAIHSRANVAALES